MIPVGTWISSLKRNIKKLYQKTEHKNKMRVIMRERIWAPGGLSGIPNLQATGVTKGEMEKRTGDEEREQFTKDFLWSEENT